MSKFTLLFIYIHCFLSFAFYPYSRHLKQFTSFPSAGLKKKKNRNQLMIFNYPDWDYNTASLFFSTSQEVPKPTATSKDLDLSRKHSSHWREFQLMVISTKCRKIIKDKETHLHIYQNRREASDAFLEYSCQAAQLLTCLIILLTFRQGAVVNQAILLRKCFS